MLIYHLQGPISILTFDVTDRHDLRIRQVHKITQQRPSSAARAYKAHHNSLARRDAASLT